MKNAINNEDSLSSLSYPEFRLTSQFVILGNTSLQSDTMLPPA